MNHAPEGDAIVYCEGNFLNFDTFDGKTANGLVRFTRRYRVRAVVDSSCSGQDAGAALDGKANGIQVVATLEDALKLVDRSRKCFFVIGLALTGGRLRPCDREVVASALKAGLNVDSGQHMVLAEDPTFAALAEQHGGKIRDIRRCPPPSELHVFTQKIEEVTSFKVAVLGTDSAIGKRTTAWKIIEGLEQAGKSAEIVGTGQTCWMQGARYSVCMDALINDFVAGELEHATWSAWHEQRPDVIVVEGQGSLLNPGFPGGYEILAATRPDVIVMQHAPARAHYSDFPKYALHPLPRQIAAVEMISEKKVVAVTINHVGLDPSEIDAACAAVTRETGLPCFDVLTQGSQGLTKVLLGYLSKHEKSR